MKLTKKDIDIQIESITTKLLCTFGLKNAKKISLGVRRNLREEENRRKELK